MRLTNVRHGMNRRKPVRKRDLIALVTAVSFLATVISSLLIIYGSPT